MATLPSHMGSERGARRSSQLPEQQPRRSQDEKEKKGLSPLLDLHLAGDHAPGGGSSQRIRVAGLWT